MSQHDQRVYGSCELGAGSKSLNTSVTVRGDGDEGDEI